jgi:hypothetical protein
MPLSEHQKLNLVAEELEKEIEAIKQELQKTKDEQV